MKNSGAEKHRGVPKSLLFTIIFIVFLDILGMTIIIPVLAPVFLDKTTTILDPLVSIATRTILLGLLIGVYPLAQFFGSPIIGSLSDHYGRKKVLFISLAGTLIGFVLFSYGLIFGSLTVLFIGRIIEGFTAGSISVALSSMADISNSKTKTKNFGLIGAAYGLGLIIGPFIGGILSDNILVSWFSYSTPFIFGAILTFINMILMLKFFPETLSVKKRVVSSVSLFTGFKNIKHAFKMKNLRTMFFVVFLIMLGFAFFIHFLPVFLIQKFDFSSVMSGYLFAYAGLWLVISQAFIVRFISKKLSPKSILSFSIVCFALSYALMAIFDNSNFLYLTIALISIFTGLTLPSFNAVISDLGDDESQGEILGINQSMQSLAQAFPPIIGGFFVAFHPNFPSFTAAIVTFIAWVIFISFYRSNKYDKFHEM